MTDTRCSVCRDERRPEIERKLLAGLSYSDGAALFARSRNTLSTHMRHHVGAPERTPGPVSVEGDYAEAVVRRSHERLAAREIEPGIRDGLTAARIVDDRSSRMADRELLLRIGALFVVRPTPIEDAEWREIPDGMTAFSPERTRELADLNPVRRAGE